MERVFYKEEALDSMCILSKVSIIECVGNCLLQHIQLLIGCLLS